MVSMSSLCRSSWPSLCVIGLDWLALSSAFQWQVFPVRPDDDADLSRFSAVLVDGVAPVLSGLRDVLELLFVRLLAVIQLYR